MSNTIEDQVLSMRFDNAQFESGVRTSLTTLEKLKSALKLDKAAEGFTSISKAASSMALEGIADSLSTISNRFTVLGTIGDQVIRNVTNKVSALTGQFTSLMTSMSPIGQMSAGWDKYEEKTKSVQTIMNATGKSIDEVETVLSKLMWFSDETSYSFTDMTSNVGKFTSQGIDLETAATAMMGISNAAALAGAGSQEASRAMYNISQAMGAGSMKLMDWKSIENANMATQQLKQSFIDAGLEAGTLVKQGDKIYTKSKKNEVTISNFSTTLSDAWMDQTTMLKGLEQYGEYAEEVYKVVQRDGISCAEAMELVSDQYMEVGAQAFKAAQEAKTFSDMVDATKDAVSSQWSTLFQNLFGNYEEAKGFWTDWSLELWDIFAAPLDAANSVLGEWHDDGGYTAWIDSIWAAWGAVRNVIDLVGDSLSNVIPMFDAPELVAWTENLRDGAERIAGYFAPLEDLSDPKDAAQELYDSFRETAKYASNGTEQLEQFQEAVEELGYTEAFRQNVEGFGDIARYLFNGDEALAAIKMGQAWNDIATYTESAAGKMAAIQQNARDSSYSYMDIVAAAQAADESGDVYTYVADYLKNYYDGLETIADKYFNGDTEQAAKSAAQTWLDAVKTNDATTSQIEEQFESLRNYAKEAGYSYEDLAYAAHKAYPELAPDEAVLKAAQELILKNAEGLDLIAEQDYGGYKNRAAAALAQEVVDGAKENDKAIEQAKEHALALQNIVTGLTSVGKGFVDTFGSGVNHAKEMVGIVADIAANTFTEVFGPVKDLDFNGPIGFFERLQEIIEGLAVNDAVLGGIHDALYEIFNAAQVLGNGVGKIMSNAIEYIPKVWQIGQNLLGLVTDTIQVAAGLGSGVVNQLKAIYKNIQPILPSAGQIFTLVRDGIYDLRGMVTSLDVSSIAGKIGDAIGMAAKLVISVAKTAWSGVKALYDIFKSVGSVAKEAFEEIFPKDESGTSFLWKIIGILSALKVRIDNFKMSEKTLEAIKSVFKGLFAVIDIGKTIFSSFWDAITPLFTNNAFGNSHPVESIVELAGKFGEFLVKVRDSVKESDLFRNIFDTVVSGIQTAAAIAGPVIDKLSGWAQKAIEILTPAVTWVIEHVPVVTGIIQNIFTAIRESVSGQSSEGGVISGFVNAIKNLLSAVDWKTVGTFISTAVNKIFSALTKLVDGIRAVMQNDGEIGALAAGGGIFGAIVVWLGTMIAAIKGAADKGGINGIIDLIKGKFKDLGELAQKILEPVTDALDAMQTKLKSDALKNIAIAIGIIAASILVLALIPPERILTSLAALTFGFAELVATVQTLEKTASSETDLLKLSGALIGMAAAILIMAWAMKSMSKIDPNAFGQALLGIGAVSALLVYMAQTLGQSEGDLSKVGGTIFAMSLGVLVMAAALKVLATIPLDKMGVALLGMVGGLGAMVAVFQSLNNVSGLGSIAGSILVVSFAMIAMAAALAILAAVVSGENGIMNMMVAILALYGGLFAMVVAFRMLEDVGAGQLIATAAAMMILSVALVAIAAAIAVLSQIDPERLAMGLVSMVAVMLAMALTLGLLSSAGVGAIAAAASMLIMAAAMVVIAAALTIFVAAFAALSLIPFGTMVMNVLKIAVAFGVMAVAGVLLAPVSGILVVFAAVMFVLSSAVFILASAMTMMAALMPIFASVMTVGALAVVGAFQVILTGVISLAPLLGQAVAAIVISIANAIVVSADAIVLAIVSVGLSILQAIEILVPAIVQTVLNVIVAVLTALDENLPTIIDKGINVMISFIDGMAEGLRKSEGRILAAVGNLLSSIIEFIISFVQTFLSQIPVVGEKINSALDSAKDGIHTFFENATADAKTDGEELSEAVNTGFRSNSEESYASGTEQADSLLGGVKSREGDASTSGSLLGFKVLNGAQTTMDGSPLDASSMLSQLDISSEAGAYGSENGLAFNNEMLSSIMSGGSDISTATGTVVNDSTDTATTEAEGASAAGAALDDYLSNGISNNAGVVKNSAKNTASQAANSVNTVRSKFYTVGQNLSEGLANGISSNSYLAVNAAHNMATAVTTELAKVPKVASPSKVAIRIGGFISKGLGIGITSEADYAVNAAGDLGNRALDAMRATIDRVRQIAAGELTVDPTIRPVVDMNNVRAGVSELNSMFGSYRASVRLAGSADIGRISAEIQNGSETKEIVSAIRGLKSDINSLGERIEKMQLVMDSGLLVGSISTEMDRSLGRIASHKARGN